MLHEFTIFEIKIPTFNFFIAIGIVVALFTIIKRVQTFRKGIDETKILSSSPFAFIIGAISAHLFDVVAHGGFWAIFDINELLKYGIAYLGFLFGLTLFLYVHSKICKIDFLFLLNIYVPALAISQAFGRIGCFLGGCCHGIPSAIGFKYPKGSLAFLKYGDNLIFPLPLCQSLFSFILFFLIMKIPFRMAAPIYFLLMPTARFSFEFFRGDNRGGEILSLSPAQIISCLFFLFGLILIHNELNKKTLN